MDASNRVEPMEANLGEGWLKEMFDEMQEERDFLTRIQNMINGPFTWNGVTVQKEDLQRLLNMARSMHAGIA